MNGSIVNDVICSKEDQFAEQQFYIRYDRFKRGYFIKDLGIGSGTFVKIQSKIPTQLRNGMIIIFGNT